MKTLISITLLLALAPFAAAQTTLLIGAGVRNGNFNDDTSATDTRSFANTPFWENIGTSGVQTGECTRSNVAFDGSRNHVLTESAERSAAQSTGHTVAAGDQFNLKYVWRDASRWTDGSDQVSIRFFVTDDDTIGGTQTDVATLLSGLSTANSTYEAVDQNTTVTGAATGKVLFVTIETFDGNANTTGFVRLDNFELSVTATTFDPLLGVDSGDYAFGDLFHLNGTTATPRTVTFSNGGNNNNLTLDNITLNDDAGGIYSITSAPSNGTVVPPGGTFDIEITATGGSGYTDYVGELLIDTTPNDQDSTFPLTGNIASTGDPFFIVDNRQLDNDLDSWSGDAVPTDGLGTTNGARVRGIGDNRSDTTEVFADNLSQAFTYQNSPDFNLTLSLAIPDFNTFTGFAPDGSVLDRSFHLAILADDALPGTGDFGDADAANTIINLFYLSDGTATDTGAGFFLYDGVGGTFNRLSNLGTLTASTGLNADGTPPTTLNTYQLTIAGSGFGTGSASYDISISLPNSTTIAGTQTGLTTYHGADPTTNLAQALVLTTSDAVGSTTNPSTAFQPTFWVDDVAVSLGATLPVALLDFTERPSVVKMFENETRNIAFTLTNVGLGSDLTLASPVIGDARFSLTSPTLPDSIAPGDTLSFEVLADMSSTTGTQNIPTTLTLTTNDSISNAQVIDLQAQILADGRRILIDYDDGDGGNGVHDASIRNGGFEDGTNGDSFADTPDWFSRFSPEGDAGTLTLATNPATGLLRGTASGFDGAGDRTQPTQTLTLEEWTLEEGDSFEVEVTWRDGIGFAANDTLQIIVEVLDEDGNIISDPVNQVNNGRLAQQNFDLTTLGTYQTSTLTTPRIQAGSPWIGERPTLRILKNGARTTFIQVDNVSLAGKLFSPEGPIDVTLVSFDPDTDSVTLRWTDIGPATYRVQSTSDLNFTSGVTEYSLDGSEDATTFPGEIEFTFTDPTASGTFHSWRIVAD